MGYAYIIEKQGGCEALKKIKLKEKPLEAGHIRIRQQYLGLNFQDILMRRGDKKVTTPFIPGSEACGIVEEIGLGVQGFHVGDKVVYATAPIGACSDVRTIKAQYAIKVPEFIPLEEVCGFFLKALWAYILTHRVYKVPTGSTVLVHSAAGGVGTVLTQVLNSMGARVIGTAGDKTKQEFAVNNGCIKAMHYHDPNFFKTICSITDNLGVNLVYDPVGHDSFEVSMLALGVFGLFVPYGWVSGKTKKLQTDLLAKKSLFLSCPSFGQYLSARRELEIIANEVFKLKKSNIIKNNICKVFEFDHLKDAHKYIEDRKAMGSVVIKI